MDAVCSYADVDLGRFLPILIGNLVEEEDEYWVNFLCLLDIMDILFARPVTTDACALAEVIISDHHSSFRELYPHLSITLKMHSMIHMPRLMLLYVEAFIMLRFLNSCSLSKCMN